MGEVRTKYSPMHINCHVGYPYGVKDSGYTCGYHTGCDFPSSGAGGGNPDLFSISEDGEVVYIYDKSTGTTPALGNQVQIFDKRTGLYYRYCHLKYGTIAVKVGDKVNLNTFLGKMGTTGNSTGTHLHLEASKTQAWQCGQFVNPVEPLGIPNIRDTLVIWDDVPVPPTPPIKNNNKKWLYSRTKRVAINYIM